MDWSRYHSTATVIVVVNVKLHFGVRRQSEAATVLWIFVLDLLLMTQRNDQQFPWPHAPTHQLSSTGTFFVTAATYAKARHFRGRNRVKVLHRGLLTVARDFGWHLEAWSVFSNHYHFIAHSPEGSAENLSAMLGLLHEKTAKWVNRLDNASGRDVWHNFWETKLTYEKSYLARLNYVHQNPVKHGLVLKANQYPWCSAGWFERTARPAQVKTIYRFKTDKLKILDDYDVAIEW